MSAQACSQRVEEVAHERDHLGLQRRVTVHSQKSGDSPWANAGFVGEVGRQDLTRASDSIVVGPGAQPLGDIGGAAPEVAQHIEQIEGVLGLLPPTARECL